MKIKLLLISFLLIFVSNSAHSHSWYDAGCCSDQDCAPVVTIEKHPEGDLMTTVHGTVLVKKNEVYKRLPSKDDKYHVCQRPQTALGLDFHDSHAGPYNRIICIYYPALY